MSEIKESAKMYFSRQCMRLVYGSCHTSRCLERGGYIHGDNDPHWDDATCEPLEAVKAFDEIERLRAELNISQKNAERLQELDDVGAKAHNANLLEMAEMRAVITQLKTERLILARLASLFQDLDRERCRRDAHYFVF